MKTWNFLQKRIGFYTFGAAIAGLLASAPASVAQDFPDPTRDIKIVVQASAGGGSDIFARTLSEVASELDLVPRTPIVENRPGGSGAVGYNYTYSQSGNPYVLQTVASNFFTLPLMGEVEFTPGDFTPIAAMAVNNYILTTNSNSGLATLQDIAQKDVVVTGTSGVVNDQSILSAMLEDEMDVEIRVVPFDSSGETVSALLGGHIDLMFANPSEVQGQIEAGNLEPVAVASDERIDSLPNVPTFTEEGYNIEHSQVRAIVMPGDVSEESKEFWEQVLGEVANSQQWQEKYLNQYNLEKTYIIGDELDSLFSDLSSKFDERLREAGLK